MSATRMRRIVLACVPAAERRRLLDGTKVQ
jgi:hypothetical protein